MNANQIIERMLSRKRETKKNVTFVPVEGARFKEVLSGASMSILWGNDEVGPFGAITRFVPGFDAGMHTHTNDVRIIVIKGAYLYKDDKGEKRVGPGDFLLIPGGTKHWSGGDAEQGVLFYNESDGKFDVTPVM